MDISIVISSYNQKKRLKFCLDSLSKQEHSDFEYEIILADDNSTDDTLEFVKKNHPDVNISLHKNSIKGTYTLADNWNQAASLARGKRIVFSNADMVFCKTFLKAHMDEIMQDSIIFGPGYGSSPKVEPILDTCETSKEVVKWLGDNNMLGKDRHAEGSADTYNREWKWNFPFGYNFSVIKKQFDGVLGFPSYKKWGEEETQLCKRIVETYGTKVKSNKFAVAIHLWHPRVNGEHTETREDDIRF